MFALELDGSRVGRTLLTFAAGVLLALLVFLGASSKALATDVAAIEGQTVTVQLGVDTWPTGCQGCSGPPSETVQVTPGDGGAPSTVTAPNIGCYGNTDDSSFCAYGVAASFSYRDDGIYTPTYTSATGFTNGSSSQQVVVADQPLNGTAATGVRIAERALTASLALGTFTDPNKDAHAIESDNTTNEYSAQIDWGDGSPVDVGTVTSTVEYGGGPFTVSATGSSHRYSDGGSYTATVTITDEHSAIQLRDPITVTDAPLRANAGGAATAVEGVATTATVATFSDSDVAPSTASKYAATIAWGDGSSSAGTITDNSAAGYSVAGTHIYAQEGDYTATTTITDGGGATATASIQLTVSDAHLAAAPLAASAVEGDTASLALATFTDPAGTTSTADYRATVSWGDGSSNAATITTNASRFEVGATHKYGEEGTFDAAITIADAGGAPPVTVHTTATVTDAPITLHSFGLAGQTGATLTGPVASFIDADPNSTAADFTATINWGDGRPAGHGIVKSDGAGGFQVTAAHTYRTSEAHEAVITVSDVGGATATGRAAMTSNPGRLSAALQWSFRFTRRSTAVTGLSVQTAPAGANVIVICKGGGCPRRTSTLTVKSAATCHTRTSCTTSDTPGAELDLVRLFHRHQLLPGATITVEVVKPGEIGRYFALRIRSGRPPAVLFVGACLAPGQSHPNRAC